MTTDLERRALALFFANTIDYADPLTLARMWDADDELRDFWLAQVRIVLGVEE